ncbi:hypothetical protein OGATHE_000463 [Ogataea polymorpha]|uniref:Uncharacterized protein n=1 Tax=Ogataea polymorpha TaxID=460523 RepID=A0A9P8TGE2_9ASCO|nr:hypothetical protein OGATHE_000463 [Ogataea polymorpha]
MWNTIAVSTYEIPLVPLSMARVRPPVCLARWKLRSRLSRWTNVLCATFMMAFWATLAKIAFLSSPNNTAPKRVTPYARMMAPIEVVRSPACETQSMFIESIIDLKKNGTWTLSTLAAINIPNATTTRNLAHGLFLGQMYDSKSLRMRICEWRSSLTTAEGFFSWRIVRDTWNHLTECHCRDVARTSRMGDCGRAGAAAKANGRL